MRRLWVRNYPGDGISWQISHDVLVEDCVLENHRNLALHPGSGSQRPIIRRNVLRGSDIGLFFCWGVKYGLAQDNQIEGNRVGISIGHRDTDNLVTGNAVAASKAQGLLFRPERGASFAGHRNRIIGNRFLNNAGHGNAVVEVQGGTQDILIANNEFAEQRRGVRTQAVKIGPEAKAIALEGNRSTGAVQLTEP
jgi:nitrous oxidase accessory protein NosD